MQHKKQTIVNVAASLVTLAIQLLISFWLSPYVVEKLGEEAFGFINLANNFVSYAALLAVALNSMASRHISVSYNLGKIQETKTIFSSVFLVNCIIFAVILILSAFFVIHINSYINVSLELLYSVKVTFFLSFFNMGFSLIGTVYTAAAYTTNKMYYNSLVQIIGNIVKGILVVALFVLLPPQIYYLSVAALFSGAIILLGNILLTKKLLPNIGVEIKSFSLPKVLSLIKSGSWLLLSNISNLFLNGLDLLFSNWFISAAIMGRLSVSKQIPFAMSIALGSFSNIFSSSLTKVFAVSNNTMVANEAVSQLKILTILFTVPYAVIIVFGLDFLSLWLGKTGYNIEQLHEIYYLMIIILLDIIISTYMYSIHSIFIAMDAVRYYSVILFISSCISVVATLLLLQFTNLGVYAIAGTSTVILGVVHGIIVPVRAAKLQELPWSYYLKIEGESWLTFFLIIILFGLSSLFIKISGWIDFIASLLLLSSFGYIITIVCVIYRFNFNRLFIDLKKFL